MPTECTPKRFDSPCVAPTRTVAPAHGSELMFALGLRRALLRRQPQQGSQCASPGHPSPLWFFAARTVSVNQRNSERDGDDEERPLAEGDQPFGAAGKPEVTEGEWKDPMALRAIIMKMSAPKVNASEMGLSLMKLRCSFSPYTTFRAVKEGLHAGVCTP